MSTVAFGALTTRREISPSRKSTSNEPPGLSSYVDTLAALVPAEVLAIHALIISIVTKSGPNGQATVTDPGTLRVAFWLLVALSAVLYVLGRRPVPTTAQQRASADEIPFIEHWEWQDWIRLVIPVTAFAAWTLLEPLSAWNAVAPHASVGMRTLIATVTAVVLAALTKALVSHIDKKQLPAALAAHTNGWQSAGKVPAKNLPDMGAPEIPVAEQPAAQRPVVQQPPVQQPPVQQPPVQQPPVQQPAAQPLPCSSPAIIRGVPRPGVTEVHRIGGAQAVAALAYGVEGIEPVDKIVGPGQPVRRAGQAAGFRRGRHRQHRRAERGRPDRRLDGRPPVRRRRPDQPGRALAGGQRSDHLGGRPDRPGRRGPRRAARQLSRGDLARESLERFGALILVRDEDEAVGPRTYRPRAPACLDLRPRPPGRAADQRRRDLPRPRHAGRRRRLRRRPLARPAHRRHRALGLGLSANDFLNGPA